MTDPLGTLLRHLREAKGIDLFDAAHALGVTVPTLSAWEVGRKRPTAARLTQLAALPWNRPVHLSTLLDLRALPLPDWAAIDATRIGIPTFVSYTHVEGADACPCNECESERMHRTRCLVCDGSGQAQQGKDRPNDG